MTAAEVCIRHRDTPITNSYKFLLDIREREREREREERERGGERERIKESTGGLYLQKLRGRIVELKIVFIESIKEKRGKGTRTVNATKNINDYTDTIDALCVGDGKDDAEVTCFGYCDKS